jgi:hypothetical protein
MLGFLFQSAKKNGDRVTFRPIKRYLNQNEVKQSVLFLGNAPIGYYCCLAEICQNRKSQKYGELQHLE